MYTKSQTYHWFFVCLLALQSLSVRATAYVKKMHTTTKHQMEIATLGGGCFWCIETVFLRIKGVVKVTSGYGGGTQKNPTYQWVCGPHNDHIELCQVEFDPEIISYKTILKIFFTSHDPTSLDKQGGDVGYQYKSIIFYHHPSQKKIALQTIQELTEKKYFSKPIVTAVEPFRNFYVAEKYHQNYYQNNMQQPYCQLIIKPKIEKIEKSFAQDLKK